MYKLKMVILLCIINTVIIIIYVGNNNSTLYKRSEREQLSIPWLSSPYLPRAMTPEQYNASIGLLHDLTTLLDEANITYMMQAGTLMGSYISHDILPWDDDSDVFVKYSDLPKLKYLFRNPKLWNRYALYGLVHNENEYNLKTLTSLPDDIENKLYYTLKADKKSYHIVKFWTKNGVPFANKPFKYPYVDIAFYKENATHVWTHDWHKPSYFNYSDIYPLYRRPLGPFWLPAPHDTGLFLATRYNGCFHCESHKFNHTAEVRSRFQLGIQCSKLHAHYPFVWREIKNNSILEHLKFLNKTIKTFVVPFVPAKYNSWTYQGHTNDSVFPQCNCYTYKYSEELISHLSQTKISYTVYTNARNKRCVALHKDEKCCKRKETYIMKY